MKHRNMIISGILMGLGFFALPQGTRAVTPAPDGGYPGFNTAEGQNALKNLTTGVGNAAVGWYSLFSNTDGSFNTAVGAGTLVLNVGNQSTGDGIENTAIGATALLLNTTGSDNTAAGTNALQSNTTGSSNTANGAGALQNNTIGVGNTAAGVVALFSNTMGVANTAHGAAALAANTTGDNNTADGVDALAGNTTGNHNTAVGVNALGDNTTGINNTATGAGALSSNTGNGNTALGNGAGSSLTTGDNNIDIGFGVTGVAAETNTVRIGNPNITTTIIRGISGTTIATGAQVLVDSNGQLGTMTSSERFKEDIKPMDKASAALFALKPVTFRYKKEIDPKGTSQFGLVAEDVEKVNSDLIVRDETGRPYSVRYEQVNAMLLNEFLKEHKTVQELKSTIQKEEAVIAEQQKSFKDRLAAEAQQIEIVRAAVEELRGSKLPQMVRNP